jgi:multiple sugar transport system substrate-binding protein
VVKQFEEENPGWKVELEAFKWDQIDQRSILDLTAGVDHDLMFSSPQLMAKHQETGDYIDLTPYIQQWPKEEQDDLNWSPGWAAAAVGGQQVGIATGVHTRTNVYNRDMFQEAGIDPDKPFTTPEEVVEAAKKLTKADQDIWGLGMYMGPSRATIELYYAPMVWHYGGDFYDPETKKAALTGEASLKATQWLYDLVFTHKVTPPYAYAADGTYDALILTSFVDGKIAQGMGFGSYWIGAIQSKDMLNNCFPATAECTVGKAGVMVQPSSVKAQFTNAWCLSIHKLSKNPDAAWKLMETVLRPENLATYPDAGLPGRLSAWAAPEYSSAFYQTWLEAAKNGRPMPPTPYYPELADTVAAAVQEILANQADIPGTLKKFEDEWNAKYAA